MSYPNKQYVAKLQFISYKRVVMNNTITEIVCSCMSQCQEEKREEVARVAMSAMFICKQTTDLTLLSSFCVHGKEGIELISPIIFLEVVNNKTDNRETLI